MGYVGRRAAMRSMLAAMAAMGMRVSTNFPKKKDRPEFTDEEIEWLKSLPKREKKDAVRRLKREKYK